MKQEPSPKICNTALNCECYEDKIMQFRSLINTIIGIVTIGSVLLVKAQDSTENAVGASTQSSQAVIMGITSSGQAALGIAAIPVLSAGAVAGTVGAGSIAAGKDSAAIATGGSNRDPLPVTDETITVVSPSEALKYKKTASPR